jgi:serine/threonine protein kinase
MQEVPEYYGKYNVEGIIGRGARGVVYRGRDPELSRVVAIKTLSQVARTHQGVIAFEKEAKLLASMRHPHIVTLFEASLSNDEPFLVMDYIDGFSIEDMLRMNQTLPPDQVVVLLAQISDALDYANESGLLHRDIKPANILLDRLGKGYLVDFGLAVLTTSEEMVSGEGSPGYMSPEAIMREPMDRRSDIFSFAVVAYELLTGQLPFTGNDNESLCRNIVTAEPRSASSLNATLPTAVDYVFLQALQKDRTHRYSSATKFVLALEKALEAAGSGIKLGRSDASAESFEDVVSNKKRRETGAYKSDAATLAEKMQQRAASEKTVFVKQTARSSVSINHLQLVKSNQDFTTKLAIRAVLGIVGGIALLLTLFFAVASAVSTDSFLRRGALGAFYDGMRKTVVGVDPQTTPPEKLSSEEIIGILRHPDRFQEAHVLRLLTELSQRNRGDAFRGFAFSMVNPSYIVKLKTLKILEQFKDEESLGIVQVAFDDGDVMIRLQAVKAALAIHSPASQQLLQAVALRDVVPEVRQSATAALVRWNEGSGGPAIE